MPKVELLAPAGTYETFKAVLHAGADAIYLAGSHFGARAYAGNLSDEELLAAIEECHIYNKRLYLTVNTLCKNDELFHELYDFILPLYEAGLDGVIVQDLGVVKFLHTHFPGLEIHASTQMTITNKHFIPFLKKYGVTRIVPARELSLEEIKELHDVSGMEIECFVHGALCYCYSGACFMSSFMGGRSGNRGRCAQPCRLEYTKDGITSALLSLKDLNTLDILPELIEHGVFSMKIEGRMKSPEYAAGITEIYRKYLDQYLEKGKEKYKVDPVDREHLLWLFDRGGITEGYYRQHNGKDMIANANKSQKSQDDKKNYEKDVLTRNLHGDYRIPIRINGYFYEGCDSVLTLTLSSNPDCSVTVMGQIPDLAINRALTSDDIQKQLQKLGNTYYRCEDIQLEVGDHIFIPNGALNELRRLGVEALNKELLQNTYRYNQSIPFEFNSVHYSQDMTCLRSNKSRSFSVHCLQWEQGIAVLDFARQHMDLSFRLILDTEILEYDQLINLISKAKEISCKVYLGMPRISRNGYVTKMETLLQKLNDQVDGYLARNMGDVSKIREFDADKEIILDYTCYAMNSYAALEYADSAPNIVSQTYAIESSIYEMKKLSLTAPELMVYGRIPLMTTANCVDCSTSGCHKPKSHFTEIMDRKNAKLPVLTACAYCYNLIFNSLPLYLGDLKELESLDYDYNGIHFTNETKESVQTLLWDIVNKKPFPQSTFTRGHFKNSVE